MTAREDVLGRVRQALGSTPRGVAVPRGYDGAGIQVDLELLVDRLVDYRAHVTRCDATGISAAVAERLRARGSRTLVAPEGVPVDWLPDVAVLREPLDNAALDGAAAVLTGCALAIALTGTIVLDHGPGQGRRALSLLPDHHLVVLRAEHVVHGLPDAVAALDPTRPMTWVSGPSATSDIELVRVEGVHGPRALDVLLVD